MSCWYDPDKRASVEFLAHSTGNDLSLRDELVDLTLVDDDRPIGFGEGRQIGFQSGALGYLLFVHVAVVDDRNDRQILVRVELLVRPGAVFKPKVFLADLS